MSLIRMIAILVDLYNEWLYQRYLKRKIGGYQEDIL